jgi:enoyl-CoA hydratase/carnithine racemase
MSAAVSNLLYEEKSEHLGQVTINRPAVLNAMDYASMVELKALMVQIKERAIVRALIITGAGEKSFVAGADKEEIKLHAEDEERGRAFEEISRETFNLIDGLYRPTICGINGYAFGLGVQLALACTFRIASANARFALPEINMGFFPSMGATQRLTRLIGEAKTLELILAGETIDATEAHRIGLVHRVVPQAEFRTAVDRFARDLSERSPVAVRLGMDAIRQGKAMSLAEGLLYEAKLSEECLKSEDNKEGRRAFTEKRKPQFKGR